MPKTEEYIFEPKSQGVIPFEGREIIKVQLEDGQGYVVLKSLAEAFDIWHTSMGQRLNRDPYYKPYTAMIRVRGKGGPQPSLCLMAAAVPLFLAGTEMERVQSVEGRKRLELFLNECMDVLAEHFGISEKDEMKMMRRQVAMMGTEHRIRSKADEQGETLSEAEILKKVHAEMAEMERRHKDEMDKARKAFADLRDTIRDYNKVAGDECITLDQQGEVQLAVKLLGQLLEEAGMAEPYQALYMDIARISGRASYKQIPKSKYKDVMDFLNRRIEIQVRRKGDGEPSI